MLKLLALSKVAGHTAPSLWHLPTYSHTWLFNSANYQPPMSQVLLCLSLGICLSFKQMAGKFQTHFSLIPRFLTITASHSDICIQRSEVKRLAIVYGNCSSGCDNSTSRNYTPVIFVLTWPSESSAESSGCLVVLLFFPLVITASTGLPFSLSKPLLLITHCLVTYPDTGADLTNSYILKIWSLILLTYILKCKLFEANKDGFQTMLHTALWFPIIVYKRHVS